MLRTADAYFCVGVFPLVSDVDEVGTCRRSVTLSLCVVTIHHAFHNTTIKVCDNKSFHQPPTQTCAIVFSPSKEETEMQQQRRVPRS